MCAQSSTGDGLIGSLSIIKAVLFAKLVFFIELYNVFGLLFTFVCVLHNYLNEKATMWVSHPGFSA